MDLLKRLSKSKFRLMSACAIAAAAAVCVLATSARWLEPTSELPAISAVCPGCHRLLGALIPSRGLHVAAHDVMIGLIVFMIAYSLFLLIWRGWKHHGAVAAIGLASQTAPPTRLRELARRMNHSGRVSVIPSERPFAFCYGLFRPRVCLSSALVDCLGDTELQAVLCHEWHHQASYAPLCLFVADFLSDTLFFIPVLRDLRDLLAFEIELSADRFAVERVGRPALAGALTRLLSHPHATAGILHPATVGLSVTDSRIAQLLGERAPVRPISGWNVVWSVLIAIGIVCML